MASRTKSRVVAAGSHRSKRGIQTADEDVAMGGPVAGSSGGKARSSSNKHLGLSGRPEGGRDERGKQHKPYSAASRRPPNRGSHNKGVIFNKVAPEPKGAIDMLKEFLARRFDQASMLLNLENMASDETFTSSKLLAPGQRSQTRSSAAPAMWKIVGEQFPQTVSVSLANNNLKELVDLAPAAMVRALPNLENLSLAGNQLSDVKALNPIMTDETVHRKGLDCLNELVLDGNPLREVALANGTYPAFVQDIATRFPTLTALDGQALQPTKAPQPVASTSRTPLGSGLKQPASFPVGMQPGFSDQTNDLVVAFLNKFFTLYDSNRSLLAHAYAPEATFSLSVNSAIPFRAKASNAVQNLPAQHRLNWQPYFDLSRNMLKTHKIDEAKLKANIKARLFQTPVDIVNAFAKLPGSKHPLTDAHKFVLDVFETPAILHDGTGTLFVTLHGEFVEQPSGGSRSFDRTFVLAPPAAGASNSEWPCLILSDNLVVRGISEPAAWAETALRVRPPPPEPSTSQPNGQPATNGSSLLTPAQQQMVVELQKATRLNLAFAQQCLQESGWDLQKATQNFQLVAAQVPPEAFI